MGHAERIIHLPARLDPVARGVIARWRRLTHGGGPTLIACSGGADSCALALCLAAAEPGELTLCYVLHPMRERGEVEREARDVAELAALLGVGFARVDLPDTPANRREGGARAARYAALARVARELGVRYVATAHHADDQLETLLMALMRGAGPRGMGGIAATRRLDRDEPGVCLIRPMLGAERRDTERICHDSGWAYADDPTNADASRLRAAVRHGVVPALRALRPGVSDASVRAGALLHDAARVVDDRARAALALAETDHSGALTWARHALRTERAIVVGQVLRLAARRLTGGAATDRLTYRALEPALHAIRDTSTEPRRFELARGLRVGVDANRVTIEVKASRDE